MRGVKKNTILLTPQQQVAIALLGGQQRVEQTHTASGGTHLYVKRASDHPAMWHHIAGNGKVQVCWASEPF